MDSAFKNKVKYEELIVISDDDDDETSSKRSKPNTAVKRRNSGQMKPKRKVSLNTKENNIETLTITQKVKVKKQKMECFINLCTNICDNSDVICIDGIESIDGDIKRDLRRNVPVCCRKKCQTKHNERRRKPKVEVPERDKNKAHRCKCKNKSREIIKHHRYSSKPKIMPKMKTDSHVMPKCDAQGILSLSPISLSPIHSDDDMLSYENISLDSFTTCSESELDSLIKRTKERDRSTPSKYDFSIQTLCCRKQKEISK